MNQAGEATITQQPAIKIVSRRPALEGEVINYDKLVEIKRARYYRLYDQIRGQQTTLKTR